MGLMQQAYETYCRAEHDYAGVYRADAREPLVPVGHWITKAQIEITINTAGKFIQVTAVPKGEAKTIYPVTENSAGRTSKGAAKVPHPLCDKFQYYLPTNTVEYGSFIAQLEKWSDSEYSHPALRPILTYLQSGTIIDDLNTAGIRKIDKKSFVRWAVIGIGENGGTCQCWADHTLFESYINWYRSTRTENTDYCMISGENVTAARIHAKGVSEQYPNAKLISANDEKGFTYRGRFLDKNEALSIGHEASQKVHNALRWVCVNQGVSFGKRMFVCWNPDGQELVNAMSIMMRKRGQPVAYKPTTYKNQLRSILNGYRKKYPSDAKAVTAVFDAASEKDGRLAMVYYSEIKAADFVERLGYWEETCCWPNGQFGIQSPALPELADFAFGSLRDGGYESDDNVKKQVMLQLVMARVEQAPLPLSIERALVQRAGNLQVIPDDKEHKYLRSRVLFTTCAVIRKYHYDHLKEECSMALEAEKKDRSYQFGRWMAIMEKIERDTYDDDDKRETNIIRRQLAFTARPYATAVSVMGQLKTAYYPQLSVPQRSFYEKQIEQIMAILSEFECELNKALGDTYLLGYYLQKKELYTAKEKTEE